MERKKEKKMELSNLISKSESNNEAFHGVSMEFSLKIYFLIYKS